MLADSSMHLCIRLAAMHHQSRVPTSPHPHLHLELLYHGPHKATIH